MREMLDTYPDDPDTAVVINGQAAAAAILSLLPSHVLACVEEEAERLKKVPTKHDRCTLDDCYCYDHQEIMEEKSHEQWQLEKKRAAFEKYERGELSVDEFRLELHLIDETGASYKDEGTE